MHVGITYGTFDTLHYGHINLLRKAKEQCDYLIVGLSTDEFNMLKGKQSFFNYEERKQLLTGIKYVDEIIPETCWEQKRKDIEKYCVNTLFMGNDWTGFFQDVGCKVVYLPRTKMISSTIIKEVLS